ncbi:MAG: hypothetical protein AAB544_06110 [Patescibacteria group bacterium]
MLLPIETLWSDKHWQVIQAIGTLPDGRVKKAIRVKRPDAVHLLAFPSPKTILILREFRPFYGTYIWMLPSGICGGINAHKIYFILTSLRFPYGITLQSSEIASRR